MRAIILLEGYELHECFVISLSRRNLAQARLHEAAIRLLQNERPGSGSKIWVPLVPSNKSRSAILHHTSYTKCRARNFATLARNNAMPCFSWFVPVCLEKLHGARPFTRNSPGPLPGHLRMHLHACVTEFKHTLALASILCRYPSDTLFSF